MMRLLLCRAGVAENEKATSASYDVSLNVRQPPLRAGVAFLTNLFYVQWYGDVKNLFARKRKKILRRDGKLKSRPW